MSIFTFLRDQELPTAAKLQRLWAHCVIAGLIKDVGSFPSTTVEWRLKRYGAGAIGKSRDASACTITEASVDRLRTSTDVGLWVQWQLHNLGALRYGISYFSYIEQLDAESIGAIVEITPREVLTHRLSTARHLNRAIKHAARETGVLEVA